MFFKRFILAIFLSKILFIPLNYSLTVNAQENQDKTIQFMTSSETNILEEKSRLNQSFQFINEMEESELKVILLNDLALNYAQLGDIERAIALLEQSLDIATNFEDLPIKIRTMLKIAKSYQQIGQKNQAIKILNNTSKLISLLEDKSLKGQLLLEISLKYGELGEEKKLKNYLRKVKLS